jgi:hypothetical protein
VTACYLAAIGALWHDYQCQRELAFPASASITAKRPASQWIMLEGGSVLRLLIYPFLAMPMHWKWVAGFTSFAAALPFALWTRSFDGSVAVWVLLLFVIAQVHGAFARRRKHRQS